MKTIEEKNNKLMANSSRYHLLRSLFLLGIIMLIIALISTSLIHDRILNSSEIEMATIWGVCFCFVLYKWANAKIQHIETIRYYKSINEDLNDADS